MTQQPLRLATVRDLRTEPVDHFGNAMEIAELIPRAANKPAAVKAWARAVKSGLMEAILRGGKGVR